MSKSEELLAKVRAAADEQRIPERYADLMTNFFESCCKTRVKLGRSVEGMLPHMETFFERFCEECQHPHPFESYHPRITSPFDYFRFGIDFWLEVVELDKSRVDGREHVPQMEKQLAAGENVVLLSNHQTEIDPQLLNILLPEFDGKIIFVAGDRVISDPMAVPFSLGCELLCIHSKKYIDHPPEKRRDKQAHNAKTMRVMQTILSEGGKIIYVAPSGGRDRKDNGEVTVAPFDEKAIEMFRLMTRHLERPCHFYPLALSTHDLLPPPDESHEDFGEPRYTLGGPVFAGIGEEIDVDHFPGSEETDRKKKREAFAHHAWSLVNTLYKKLPQPKG